jgi:hypothetical protein
VKKTAQIDISALAFLDEEAAVHTLLTSIEPLAGMEASIMARAKTWTEEIRERGIGHGVEAFLHAYGLDTKEGVALMCLAEALLRIPDSATADALIYDTFERGAIGSVTSAARMRGWSRCRAGGYCSPARSSISGTIHARACWRRSRT